MSEPNPNLEPHEAQALWLRLCEHAKTLGFAEIGVSNVDLGLAEVGLMAWLAEGSHGDMAYMASHGLKRARPAELVEGTLSVLTARMDYLPRHAADDWQTVELNRPSHPSAGTVSIYARGRDYHRVLRQRLARLAEAVQSELDQMGKGAGLAARAFTDSAPVLEVELASRSGTGWRGKHTLALHRDGGSLFFLGEIFLNVALPETPSVESNCGSCSACITACPTQAITAPYRLDARRCISYLTIEHAGAIPLEFRAAIGNRIYGCDDCQTACPWNKFAQRSPLPDFDERAGLNAQALSELLGWSEARFLAMTEGSAIRRIGHQRWQRNACVAAGNALRAAQLPASERDAIVQALRGVLQTADELVCEHARWALEFHE